MSENNEVAPEQPSGISRRTVTKAMAWAVPAIAVAAPVPAFAASGPKPIVSVGTACKNPGGSCHVDVLKFGYSVPVTLINNSSEDIWIGTPQVVAQSPSTPVFTGALYPAGADYLPASGGTLLVYFVAQSTNSANIQNGSITFEVDWFHDAAKTDPDHLDDPIVVTTTWAATPPSCNCGGPTP